MYKCTVFLLQKLAKYFIKIKENQNRKYLQYCDSIRFLLKEIALFTNTVVTS